jgi:hypothetical protein
MHEDDGEVIAALELAPKIAPERRNYRAGYRIRTGDLQLGNKSKGS